MLLLPRLRTLPATRFGQLHLFPKLTHRAPRTFLVVRCMYGQATPYGQATTWVANCYPPARRSDHVDVYKSETKGEVRVEDPYQWMEQNTEETERWTTAQEAYTREYLDKNADRQVLEDEIRKNTDYAKVGPNVHDVWCLDSDAFDNSSPHLVSKKTVGGTGTTIVVCSRSLVCSQIFPHYRTSCALSHL